MRELPQYPHPTWPGTIPLMARVELPDIPGIIERGSEKDIEDPSVKAARGIGETASRVMLRNLANQANSVDPNAIVGAQEKIIRRPKICYTISKNA